MTEDEIRAVATAVVARVRPTMRRVIGDATAVQYDRADRLAAAIATAVEDELSDHFGKSGPREDGAA